MSCWTEFPPVPVPDEQLLQIMLACDDFRKHWAKFNAMPFDATFEGEVDDIGALDYLQYEGLDFLPGGIEVVAMVWGNVLVRQLGFRWVCSIRGDLLLFHDAPDPDFRVVLWPLARVLEAEMARMTQFDLYGWLTLRTITSFLGSGDISPEFEVRLRRFREQLCED